MLCADTALIATAPLRNRTSTPLSLTAPLGKSVVVTATTPLAGRGGYYCDVCLCLLKDSSTYLTHINGRKHSKKLGMTMKVERVGLDEVKDKLQQHTQAAAQHAQQAARFAVKRKRPANAAEKEEDEGEVEEVGEEGEGEDERKQRGGEGREDGVERREEKALATQLARTEEQVEEEALMASMGFQFKAFAAGKGT